jgi:hypothetical protein
MTRNQRLAWGLWESDGILMHVAPSTDQGENYQKHSFNDEGECFCHPAYDIDGKLWIHESIQ